MASQLEDMQWMYHLHAYQLLYLLSSVGSSMPILYVSHCNNVTEICDLENVLHQISENPFLETNENIMDLCMCTSLDIECLISVLISWHNICL